MVFGKSHSFDLTHTEPPPPLSRKMGNAQGRATLAVQSSDKFVYIYPSHGYTALAEDEICKKYQAILAS